MDNSTLHLSFLSHSESGKLYSFGCGSDGQLGHGNCEVCNNSSLFLFNLSILPLSSIYHSVVWVGIRYINWQTATCSAKMKSIISTFKLSLIQTCKLKNSAKQHSSDFVDISYF